MKQKILFLLLFLLIACQSKKELPAPSASPDAPPIFSSPVHSPSPVPALPSPSPSPSLAPMIVSTPEARPSPSPREEDSSWPPQGEGCEKFALCCEQAQKIRPKVSVLCLAIASKKPVDCARSLREVIHFLKERSAAIPIECAEE